MNYTKETTKKIFPFIIIWIIYFLNVFSRIIFSALSPNICQNLNVNTLQLGNLFFCMAIGFGISLFCSHFISSVFSHKYVITFSCFFISISLLFAANCNSFSTFKFSLFCIGLSSGAFLPSAIAITTSLFSPKNWGKIFGLLGLAQGLPFFIAPYFAKINISSKALLLQMGIIIFYFGMLTLFFFKNSKQKNENLNFSFYVEILTLPSFWFTIILSGITTGLNVGVYNMIFNYFAKNSLANYQNYISFARFLGLFATIIGGFIADKLGLKKGLIYGLFLSGLLTVLLGLAKIQYSVIIFCLHAPVAICLNPMLHLAISNLVPNNKNASIVSLVSSFGFIIGTGFIPQIIGFFGSLNLYAFGFTIFGLLILFKAFLLAFKTFSQYIPSKTFLIDK